MEDPNMTKPTNEQLREAAKDFRADTDFDRGAEHVDLSGPTTQISIRLPDRMIDILKTVASRRGLGYQTLMKQWLDERIREEAAADDVDSSLEAQLKALTRLVVTGTVAGLEERLGDLDRRLASVEDLEARILDRVEGKTGV